MTAPHQPRTLHEVWTAAAMADYPAPLSKRIFQGLEHCQDRGRDISDALETIALWLRGNMDAMRVAVLAARSDMDDAQREILHHNDDAAGAHAEDASRAVAPHEQLDPLRDLCDSVNLACDNTIVGWQGMAEQAATEAIAALEAWLDANK